MDKYFADMGDKFQKKQLLFDLDGTLTDPKEGIIGCISFALTELGSEAPPADQLTWCIGPPLLGSFQKLLGQERADEALRLYRKRFSEVGMFENLLYTGVDDTLRLLNQKGFTLFVATSKPRVFAEKILVHFGLSQYFQKIYGSELDGRLSDKGELIGSILDQEKLPLQSTIMIGDREHDIIGAKKCGVTSVGVLWGYGSERELLAAGADRLCTTPPGLPEVFTSFD